MVVPKGPLGHRAGIGETPCILTGRGASFAPGVYLIVLFNKELAEEDTAR